MSDTYKFNKDLGMVERGKDRYASKETHTECGVCFGGGKHGLFACENCKGTGKIKQEEEMTK